MKEYLKNEENKIIILLYIKDKINISLVSYPENSDSPDLECLPLNEDYIDKAARLYTDIFLTYEPTSHHHATDPELFFPYARYYASRLIKKGFSYIIRDNITDDLIGFIFAFDLSDNFWQKEEEMRAFISHFHEAVVMIEELENNYFLDKKIIPGSTIHIFQIGVCRKYWGKGIAGMMIGKVLSSAKICGYKRVIADCTSQSSRRAFEKNGFNEVGFLPYENFLINEILFFEGLKGGISLMIKDITDAKDPPYPLW